MPVGTIFTRTHGNSGKPSCRHDRLRPFRYLRMQTGQASEQPNNTDRLMRSDSELILLEMRGYGGGGNGAVVTSWTVLPPLTQCGNDSFSQGTSHAFKVFKEGLNGGLTPN